MSGIPLTGLLVLAAVISGSCACSCFGESNICQGDFAAAILVRDNGTVADFRRTYKIFLFEFFISFVPMDEIDTSELHTGSDGGSCGITLQPGKYYIISGTISEPTEVGGKAKLYTGLCNKRILKESAHELDVYEFPGCR